MSMELTDKTHVLVTRLGDFWVNQERGNNIMAIIGRDPKAQIEFDGSFVMAQNVEGLLSASQYNDLQCKRRGMWQCKYMQARPQRPVLLRAKLLNRTRTYAPIEEERPELTDEQKAAAKQRLDAAPQVF